MEADRVTLAAGAALVLGSGMALMLLLRRRRLPRDLTGQVAADAYLAMLRALTMLLVGLGLAIAVMAAGRWPFADVGRGVAVALVAIGGSAFLARAALYLLRIRPELDRLRQP